MIDDQQEKEKEEHLRVYLTDTGRIVAAGIATMRMHQTGKSLKEVLEDNEKDLNSDDID